MPMPEGNPEEEVEKELWQQVMAQIRVYKQKKGIEVESEVEIYEDLELVLVQEVVQEQENVSMVGPSGTGSSWILHVFVYILLLIFSWWYCTMAGAPEAP